MTKTTDDGPPNPPFEINDDTVETPTGKVRERVRQVLSSITEPTKVSLIADMADCSKQGAREALREYAELGVVNRVNDNPELYERNPAYFKFLRGHQLARDHDLGDIRERLREVYQEHRRYAKRFDADSPDEIDVDERDDEERFQAVLDWEATLEEADDLREAHEQKTGEKPAPIEKLPVRTAVGDDPDGHTTGVDELPSVDFGDIAPFVGGDPTLLINMLSQQEQVLESIEEKLTLLKNQSQEPGTEAGQ
jgi:hypothetical protein